MKIAIRMDDITPDMHWGKFLQFKALLDHYEIKPLIGVVPDNQDAHLKVQAQDNDFWNYIKLLQEDGWCIAQHGYQHLYHTKKEGIFPLNRLSEFAGMPYEQQYDMLHRGKKILESHGIYTNIFMAPAHSFDLCTLTALAKLGFKYVTDGYCDIPYERSGLTFLPITKKKSDALKRRKAGFGTLVIHTNNLMSQEFYEQLFEQNLMNIMNFNELMKTPAKRFTIYDQMKEYYFAKLKQLLVHMIVKKN